MPAPFTISELEESQDFKALQPQQQEQTRLKYLRRFVLPDENFLGLKEPDKAEIANRIMGTTELPFFVSQLWQATKETPLGAIPTPKLGPTEPMAPQTAQEVSELQVGMATPEQVAAVPATITPEPAIFGPSRATQERQEKETRAITLITRLQSEAEIIPKLRAALDLEAQEHAKSLQALDQERAGIDKTNKASIDAFNAKVLRFNQQGIRLRRKFEEFNDRVLALPQQYQESESIGKELAAPIPGGQLSFWERMRRPHTEILADPTATRVEKFLAGVTYGMRQAGLETPRAIEAGRIPQHEEVMAGLMAPFSGLASGLIQAGVPQPQVKQIMELPIALTPALGSFEVAAARQALRSMGKTGIITPRPVHPDPGAAAREAWATGEGQKIARDILGVQVFMDRASASDAMTVVDTLRRLRAEMNRYGFSLLDVPEGLVLPTKTGDAVSLDVVSPSRLLNRVVTYSQYADMIPEPKIRAMVLEETSRFLQANQIGVPKTEGVQRALPARGQTWQAAQPEPPTPPQTPTIAPEVPPATQVPPAVEKPTPAPVAPQPGAVAKKWTVRHGEEIFDAEDVVSSLRRDLSEDYDEEGIRRITLQAETLARNGTPIVTAMSILQSMFPNMSARSNFALSTIYPEMLRDESIGLQPGAKSAFAPKVPPASPVAPAPETPTPAPTGPLEKGVYPETGTAWPLQKGSLSVGTRVRVLPEWAAKGIGDVSGTVVESLGDSVIVRPDNATGKPLTRLNVNWLETIGGTPAPVVPQPSPVPAADVRVPQTVPTELTPETVTAFARKGIPDLNALAQAEALMGEGSKALGAATGEKQLDWTDALQELDEAIGQARVDLGPAKTGRTAAETLEKQKASPPASKEEPPYYRQAVALVQGQGEGAPISISFIQSRLKLDFSTASMLVQQMEKEGILSPGILPDGTQVPRTVNTVAAPPSIPGAPTAVQPPSEVKTLPAEVPSTEPTPERVSAEGTKEPWEMTYEELRRAVSPSTLEELELSRPILAALYPEEMTSKEDPWGIRRAVERGDELPRTHTEDLSQRHRRSIRDALARGASVPPEVLAEYPDLAPKAPVSAPPEKPTRPAPARKPTEQEGPVEIGKWTVRPSGTWRVVAEDGSVRGFTHRGDAERSAKEHGGRVEPTDTWSVGRYIDGAWNGRAFKTKQEAIAQAESWLEAEKRESAGIRGKSEPISGEVPAPLSPAEQAELERLLAENERLKGKTAPVATEPSKALRAYLRGIKNENARYYASQYAAWFSGPRSSPEPVPRGLYPSDVRHIQQDIQRILESNQPEVPASTKGKLIPYRRPDGSIGYKTEPVAPEPTQPPGEKPSKPFDIGDIVRPIPGSDWPDTDYRVSRMQWNAENKEWMAVLDGKRTVRASEFRVGAEAVGPKVQPEPTGPPKPTEPVTFVFHTLQGVKMGEMTLPGTPKVQPEPSEEPPLTTDTGETILPAEERPNGPPIETTIAGPDAEPATTGETPKRPAPARGQRRTEQPTAAAGTGPVGTGGVRQEGPPPLPGEPSRPTEGPPGGGAGPGVLHPSAGEVEGTALGDEGQTPAGGIRGAGSTDILPEKPERPGVQRVEETPPSHTSQPSDRPGRNYVITAEDKIGQGTETEKYRANVEAIRTLKKIEEEGRLATPEEQAKLVRYVGWGGLSKAFDPSLDPEHWENKPSAYGWRSTQEKGPRETKKTDAARYDEVKALLTDAEWEAAANSTRNAHYTSEEVVRAMWDALRRMGIKKLSGKLRLVEPGMGIGHFLGMEPPELAAKTAWTGVELDPLTARIAKQLYQAASIHESGLQDVPMPDNFYHGFIGNWPFAKEGVFDPAYKKEPIKTTNLHNYFMFKAIDKTAPGGVVAAITSRYTMDGAGGASKRMRELMAQKADLIGAIRLPRTAFEKNAGTEVVTDIMFFRKRRPEDVPGGEQWMDVAQVKDAEGNSKMVGEEWERKPMLVNEYFINHPDMVLGEHSDTGTMQKKRQYTVEPPAGGEEGLRRELMDAVYRLPKDILDPIKPRELVPREMVPNAEDLIEGSFLERDGKLWKKEGPNLVRFEVPDPVMKRARGILGVREAWRQSILTQLDPSATEEALNTSRQSLNQVYDDFVKRYGRLHDKDNLRSPLADDPEFYNLVALENYDAKTGEVSKADIFRKRTVEPYRPLQKADTAFDALIASLNETGVVDLDRMQELTGKSGDSLVGELADYLYHNPEGSWETSDLYLSGNVRKKLVAAEAAVKTDPKYRRNVEALKKVIPADVPPEKISVRLGSPWVPPETVRQFVSELFQVRLNRVTVEYEPKVATWDVKSDEAKRTAIAIREYGTEDFDAIELINKVLNMRTIVARRTVELPGGGTTTVKDKKATIAARDKATRIKQRFREWLWENDDRAADLVRTYNDEMNAHVPWAPDGSHIALPGANPNVKLYQHQRDWIWRGIRGGNFLLAGEPGTGKTYTMAAIVQSLRRMGLRKKPMVVVANDTIEQFAAQWKNLFPAARLLVSTRDSLSPGNRREFLGRIANGDWDAVIVTQSQFVKIPVSDKLQADFLSEQLRELDDAIIAAERREAEERGRKQRKSTTVKKLHAARDRLSVKLEKIMEAPQKDPGVVWERLGVDYLAVDESHAYKNLFFVTKMENTKGLPGGSETGRSMDMYLKVRHVQAANNGSGVLFATGTPLTNSVFEVFNLQRYLQPELLKELSLEHADAWAQNFGEIITKPEYGATGQIAMVSRFAEFANLPELSAHLRQVMEYMTTEEAASHGDYKLPEIERIDITSPETDAIKAFVKSLLDREGEVRKRSGPPEKGEDNILVINTDGKKAAMDMRLVDATAKEEPEGKLNKVAEAIHKEWENGKKDRSTQAVFIDYSIPHVARGKPAGPKWPKFTEGDIVTWESSADTLSKGRVAAVSRDQIEIGTEKGRYTLKREDVGKLKTINGEIYEGARGPVRASPTQPLEGWDFYNALKKKLIEKGIPAKEIAFIQDYPREKRTAILERVNKGDIRVIMGSREIIGKGVNMQERMIAAHQVDPPYRPDQLEQSDKRVQRAGNMHPKVRVYYYVQKRSYDAVMWEFLKTKNRMVTQLLRNPQIRTMGDIGPVLLNYAQMQAVAVDNPDLLRKVVLESELDTLVNLRWKWQEDTAAARNAVIYLPKSLASEEKKFVAAKQDAADIDAAPKDFALTLPDGTVIEKAGEAGQAIGEAAQLVWHKGHDALKKFKYKGFTVIVRGGKKDSLDRPVQSWVENRGEESDFKTYEDELETVTDDKGEKKLVWKYRMLSDQGIISSLNAAIQRIHERPGGIEKNIRKLKADLASAERLAPKKFEYEGRFKEITAELEELRQRLGEHTAEAEKDATLDEIAEGEDIRDDSIDVGRGTEEPEVDTGTVGMPEGLPTSDVSAPGFRSPTTPGEAQELVKRRDIVKAIERSARVVRKGQIPRRFRGVFKPRPEVIRLQNLTDVEAVSHEVGHLAQKYVSFPYTPEQEARLESMGRALYKGRKAPEAGYVAEGLSEFVRLYVEDPQRAEAKVAGFTAIFEDAMQQRMPEVLESLLHARKMLDLWRRQPALAKVISRLAVGNADKPSLSLQDQWRRLVADWEDRDIHAAYIDQAMSEGRELRPEDSVYLAARIYRHVDAVSDTFIEDGPLVYGTAARRAGPGLREILQPIGDHLLEFKGYMTAWRLSDVADHVDSALEDIAKLSEEIYATRQAGEQPDPGLLAAVNQAKDQFLKAKEILENEERSRVTREDFRSAVAETERLHPEFKEAARQLWDFQDQVQQYRRDAGIESEEKYERITRAWPHFVPIEKAGEIQGFPYVRTMRGGRSLTAPPERLKRYKGSPEDIIDPLETIYRRTDQAVRDVARNEVVARLYAEEQSSEGKGMLFESVKGPGTNTVAAWIDGELKYLRVHPDVYQYLNALAELPKDFLASFFRPMTALLRYGVTTNPKWIANNLFRDQFDAFIQAVSGYRPTDTGKAIKMILDRSPEYQQFLASGGAQGGLYASMTPEGVRLAMAKMLENPTLAKRMLFAATHPFAVVSYAAHVGEEATRLGQFLRAQQANLEAGMSERGAMEHAAIWGGAEATLDFRKQGAKAAVLNQIIPFFAPGVNAIGKFFRTWRARPMQTFLRGMFITAISTALWYLTRDDPRFRDLPEWERVYFWNIPLNGTIDSATWERMTAKQRADFERTHYILPVPKPFVWGQIFGTLAEMLLERFVDKHPEALNRIGNSFAQGFGVPLRVAGLVPLLENAANYDFFRERQIVPDFLERAAPFEQYTAYTPEVYRRLGRIGAKIPVVERYASPLKIQHLVEGMTGGLGRELAKLTSKGLEALGGTVSPKVAGGASDIPFVGGFVARTPSGQSQALQDLHTELRKAREAAFTVKRVRALPGRQAESEEYAAEHPEIKKVTMLEAAARKESEIGRAQAAIRNSTQGTPETRRAKIEELQEERIKLATEVLRAIGKREPAPRPAPARGLSRAGSPPPP